MAEIKISWSAIPQGLVGPRPQKIKLNEKCRFTCIDPGELRIEFINDSPLHKDKKVLTIDKDVDFVAQKEGKFKFICELTPPGATKPIRLGDPNNPNSPAGGEIEIGK